MKAGRIGSKILLGPATYEGAVFRVLLSPD